jgi:hypothetical protein
MWIGHGWFPRSLVSGRRVRHPTVSLRPRPGYAVDNSPWPPNPDSLDPARSSPPLPKKKEGWVRTATQPRSAGLELVKFQET